MTERTLGAVRKRLRAGQRACWMADSSHGPCPPDFFAIFAQLIAEVVEVEVDSTNHCYCAWGRGVAGAVGRGAGKFGGSSASFRTAFVAPKNSQRYETLEASGLQHPIEFAASPPR